MRRVYKTLGCTSPVLERSIAKDTVIFLADGRFHMEGAMIANPTHRFFRYNPYEQTFTLEEYDFVRMVANRRAHIFKSPQSPGRRVGIILGVLGRQGSLHILGVTLSANQR